MKEMLETYVELMNRYDENPGVSTQMLFRKQELVDIKHVQDCAENDIELKRLIIDFQRLLPDERKDKLKEYLNKLEAHKLKEQILENNASMEEREIARRYNIPLSNIRRCYLSNGIELFQIHNETTELDEIIELQESSGYQKARVAKALKMVTEQDLKDEVERIDRMNNTEKKKFNYIINNRSINHVKAMNLKHFVYLNENDELLEVMYDEKFQGIKVRKTDEPYKIIYDPIIEEDEELEEENKIIPMRKSGFINAFLLFLFTGFTGGVLATVLSLVLSKM